MVATDFVSRQPRWCVARALFDGYNRRMVEDRDDTGRPTFLPKGAIGFASDNVIWLSLAAAGIIALLASAFRDAIFG